MTKRYKILYILTKSDLGGVSKYLLEIIKHLPSSYEPFFIMTSSGYFSEELEKLGYKSNINFVTMTNSIYDIKTHILSIINVCKIIKKIKPNLIHCNSTTGGIVGRIAGFLSSVPIIFTAHGWAFTDGISKPKQIFYKILETILATITNFIICVSEYDRQLALKTMPLYKNKLITIHNGISDIPAEFRKTSFSIDEIKIVMVARFCPQKDPYTLIYAVKHLIDEGNNIKLDLYGYGEELNKVLKIIQDVNSPNICYRGEISDVTPILNHYDIYALTSNWEGLPIGIIEAMRAGLPILVSNVGGNSECINNNGFLVARQDINDCYNKLKVFWDKKENLSEYSVNSRKHYEKEFTADILVTKTLSVYKKLC